MAAGGVIRSAEASIAATNDFCTVSFNREPLCTLINAVANERDGAQTGMGIGKSSGAKGHGEHRCQRWLMDISADGGRKHPRRAVSAAQLTSGTHGALQWLHLQMQMHRSINTITETSTSSQS